MPPIVVGMEMDLVAWLADTPSWALLLGVLAPLLTAAVNQPRWGKVTRQAVAIGIAVVLGVLGCLADGSLADGGTVLQVVAVVVVASHAAYKTVMKHLAGKVEQATSAAESNR